MSDREQDVRVPRRAARRKAFQPAQLRAGTATHRVHLLDLSMSGALLNLPNPPGAGTMVTLTCGPLTRSGRVVWANDPRFGIAFILPLAAAEVEAVIGAKATPGSR